MLTLLPWYATCIWFFHALFVPVRVPRIFFIFIQKFYLHLQYVLSPIQPPFAMLFFHYLACPWTSSVLFQSLTRLAQNPSFISVHLLASTPRRGEPAGTLCDPAPPQWGCDFRASRACTSFQQFFMLIPAQRIDLAQLVTASIEGQCTLNHTHKSLQKVFRENLV